MPSQPDDTGEEIRIGNAEETLDALVKLLGESVYAVDLDGKILSWNSATEALYGYSAADALGAVLPHVDAKERARVIARNRAIAAAGSVMERDGFGVCADSNRLAVREALVPFDDDQGLAAGLLVVAGSWSSDSRLGVARDQLTVLLGHSLREPMAALVSAAQLMARPEVGGDSSRRAALSRTIVTKAKLAARLAADMGLVSEFLAGSASLTFEPADVSAVVHEAIASVEEASERLVVEFDPSLDPVALDRARVRRAVGIMLEAALSVTPADGQASVAFSSADDYVSIEVKDDGPRIRRSECERVFERFYSGSEPRGKVVAGLGLYLVREVARAHRGHASARVRDGGGTILSISLPMTRSRRTE